MKVSMSPAILLALTMACSDDGKSHKGVLLKDCHLQWQMDAGNTIVSITKTVVDTSRTQYLVKTAGPTQMTVMREYSFAPDAWGPTIKYGCKVSNVRSNDDSSSTALGKEAISLTEALLDMRFRSCTSAWDSQRDVSLNGIKRNTFTDEGVEFVLSATTIRDFDIADGHIEMSLRLNIRTPGSCSVNLTSSR